MVGKGLVRIAVILSVILTISGQRQCPRLQSPWNGQFIGPCNSNVGAQCMFQCRDPYILVGSSVRVCRNDGTWSGASTACELDACPNCNRRSSNCPNLYYPNYGYAEGQCTPGIAGEVCVFRCNNGYSLDGPSRLTCLTGGQWSSMAPSCQRTSAALCEDIVVPNGRTTCSQEGGLAVCRVACEEGYMIVGSSVLTCTSSGIWNEQIPSCRPGSVVDVANVCPTLLAPEGGRLVGRCTAANTGDTCQLVCLSGYRPSDTRVLICQTNGRWTNSLPRCIGDSRSCPLITVSEGTTSGNCGPAQVGHICTITCNTGYDLAGGGGTLVCQANGEWSGTIPTCRARPTCPPLVSPVSGGVSGTCSPGQVGQTCTFSCNPGYQLVGQSTLTCGSDGRWSGNTPYCTAGTCPKLDAPANGVRSDSCVQATAGQTCTFSCQAGYVLNGQATLFCQIGGTWSSPPPTCTRVTCPNLNAPANGVTSGTCSQAAVGQSCTFACQAGYVLNGSPTLVCQDGGRWSGGTPSCTPAPPTSCANLARPSNGFIDGNCAPGRIGQTCVYACNDGFTLQGQKTLTCLSTGMWSHDAPQCISSGGGGNDNAKNCPTLTPPPNSNFLECDNRPGGQCTVVCDNGFSRSGSRVRTCLSSGVWSGYAPTCTRTVGYKTTYTKYKVVPLWTLVFG